MIEIQGNGNIVTREKSVSTFIRLHLSGRGLIELHQGEEEKVIIETDENLLEYFSVENSGRTLFVSTQSGFRWPVFTHCVIKVFIRQMSTLLVRNEGGNVTCPKEITLSQPLDIKVQSEGNTQLNLAVPSIKILCQSEGNVELQGSCERIDIKNQSEGDFDSSHLKAGHLTIRNMAEGNVKLFADKTIRITHMGEGYIHYYGSAVVEDVKQYGEGQIKHMKSEPQSL